MHIVLATFGTDGDVFPFLGLGQFLAARGHAVTLAASDDYRAFASQCGFKFRALIPQDETNRVLANPDFWHPLKGGPLAARWGIQFLAEQYSLLAELVREPGTVLAANPAVLAARLIRDRYKIPLASVILQPWILPSLHRPPVIMAGGATLPRGSPRWVWRIYFRLLNLVGDILIGRRLNKFRDELSLPRRNKVFDWWFSPDLILGLFDPWFGPPQPDWPPQLRVLSFPLFDGTAQPSLSPDLQDFLRRGDRPVAITFGTGISHAAPLYRAALQACESLGKRAIILTKHLAQLPRPLPDGFHAASYAPFSVLFPKCAAIVHHGGIGTLSQGAAAGVPQLVIPISFDQLDNALRLQSAGRGSILQLSHATASRIAESLREILQAPAPRVTPPGPLPSPFPHAAALLESLVQPRSISSEISPLP